MRVINRYPPLTKEYVLSILNVDTASGKCFWSNVSKYHRRLNGEEAGTPRTQARTGKLYWHIKINGIPYKRSYLVYVVSTGAWPNDLIDHIDGNSLNDSSSNLRDVTIIQNSWNQPTRAKRSRLPMGLREMPNGSFQVRITCNKEMSYLGTYPTIDEAKAVYRSKRKELFGAYSGL